MKAFILAGGKGERLHPLTKTIPKPLVEVNGISILDRIIKFLKDANIYDIYISVGYLSFQIEKHIKKYRQTEINIYYKGGYTFRNSRSSIFIKKRR